MGCRRLSARFTNTVGDANKVVRNAGHGNGLEAWRRLHNEYDPSSSVRRVAVLGLVQNPPKAKDIESLGKALEDWLERKRQYEDFTDANGDPRLPQTYRQSMRPACYFAFGG